MCCTRLVGNTGRKKSPFWHHRTTLSGYIFGIKACIDNLKKMLNSNTSSTCPDNIVTFGLLTAEIRWRVWRTPANFNGFRVLAALLHCTLVVGVSQTLRRWTEGATYIRQGGRHIKHTFVVFFDFRRGSVMKWNKIILKNFRMFQCFILTWNHVWNETK